MIDSTDSVLSSGDSYCPCCGHKRDLMDVAVYTTAADNANIDTPVFIEPPEKGLMPSCGYWPHELHERYVRERIKPVNQVEVSPIIHRKQFMQLSTFRNIMI